jgi:hypothetical protein
MGVLVGKEEYLQLYYDCEYVMESKDGSYVFGVDARTVLHLSHGPFMNDPLWDDDVNAKIVFNQPTFTTDDNGTTLVSLPVIASDDIEKDGEIFVSYGRVYWHNKLMLLPPKLVAEVLRYHPI